VRELVVLVVVIWFGVTLPLSVLAGACMKRLGHALVPARQGPARGQAPRPPAA